MTELQAIEIGYFITLSGQDIADLAAFAADAEQQQTYSLADVPDQMESWFLSAPYWLEDDWPQHWNPETERFE